jgi:hypothetical protein
VHILHTPHICARTHRHTERNEEAGHMRARAQAWREIRSALGHTHTLTHTRICATHTQDTLGMEGPWELPPPTCACHLVLPGDGRALRCHLHTCLAWTWRMGPWETPAHTHMRLDHLEEVPRDHTTSTHTRNAAGPHLEMEAALGPPATSTPVLPATLVLPWRWRMP